MIVTIIVLYSFIVRGFKRNKQIEQIDQTDQIEDNLSAAVPSTSVNPLEGASTSSACLEQSNNNNEKVINSNKGNLTKKNSILKLASLASVDEEEYLHNAAPSARKIVQYNDDIDDCNQLTDEEDFYNIISTQATGFHSKRHSSSASSKSSIYGSSILLYDGRRNNSQSSTTSSELLSESRIDSSRRLSAGTEDNTRISNRKINYKTRRHGFQTTSKRRRTTGRY